MNQNGFDIYKIAESFKLEDGRRGYFVRDRKTGKIVHAFLEGKLIRRKELSILFGEIMKNSPGDFILSREILHDLKKVAPVLKKLDEDMGKLNANSKNLAEDIRLVREILDEAFLREIEKARNNDKKNKEEVN